MILTKYMRRLYDWVLSWANTRYGPLVLFLMAFGSSSFFPVPPDALLIALCMGDRAKSFFFAFLSTVGSLLGGILGYIIGVFFFESIGVRILDFYGLFEEYERVQVIFDAQAFWSIFAAALSPIPYKVFTIAGGVFRISLLAFILGTIVARSIRYFGQAGLIWFFGGPIKTFIDRYFSQLAFLFVILIIGGFFAIQFLF